MPAYVHRSTIIGLAIKYTAATKIWITGDLLKSVCISFSSMYWIARRELALAFLSLSYG